MIQDSSTSANRNKCTTETFPVGTLFEQTLLFSECECEQYMSGMHIHRDVLHFRPKTENKIFGVRNFSASLNNSNNKEQSINISWTKIVCKKVTSVIEGERVLVWGQSPQFFQTDKSLFLDVDNPSKFDKYGLFSYIKKYIFHLLGRKPFKIQYSIVHSSGSLVVYSSCPMIVHCHFLTPV